MLRSSMVSGLIVLALTGYLSYGIYVQHQQRLRAIQEELQVQQETEALREKLASSIQELERLRKRLPPEPEPEWLVGQVAKLAEQTGIKLTSIVPENPRQFDEFTHLSVSLQFTTSYHQLGAFISTLESSPSFVRVDQLDLSRGQQEDTASVRVAVSTVYLPPTSSWNLAKPSQGSSSVDFSTRGATDGGTF